jgi:hypothetical protein
MFLRIRQYFQSILNKRLEQLSEEHTGKKDCLELYIKEKAKYDELRGALLEELLPLFEEYLDSVAYIVLEQQEFYYKKGIKDSNIFKKFLFLFLDALIIAS